jgi:hypothetical protein
MRDRVATVLSILAAVVGWWGLYELTGSVTPDQPGALSLFFALLFLAVTATVAPAAAALNRRLAPEANARDPWRFLRHGAWTAVCVDIWAWLQIHRALNLGYAIVIALIFVAIEVLIVRLRSEPEQGPRPRPDSEDRNDRAGRT